MKKHNEESKEEKKAKKLEKIKEENERKEEIKEQKEKNEREEESKEKEETEEKAEETKIKQQEAEETKPRDLEELTRAPIIRKAEITEIPIEELSTSGEMPTPTLISNTRQESFSKNQFQEREPNLEQSATGFMATIPIDSGISGGNTMSESVYSGQVYQEYFDKSYATNDYESREKETRDMIRREKFARETTLPTVQVVQRRWDEVSRQVNIGNWERTHEEGARDYLLENIAKKETKKRKRIE